MKGKERQRERFMNGRHVLLIFGPPSQIYLATQVDDGCGDPGETLGTQYKIVASVIIKQRPSPRSTGSRGLPCSHPNPSPE